MTLPLFVYGTLRRSQTGDPHALLREARFLSFASMPGRLYDLGSYPGAYRDSGTRRRVFGELYQLPAETTTRALWALDRYEGPEFVRQRVLVTVRRGPRRAAWAYVLRKRPEGLARPVRSGRYQSKRDAAEKRRP